MSERNFSKEASQDAVNILLENDILDELVESILEGDNLEFTDEMHDRTCEWITEEFDLMESTQIIERDLSANLETDEGLFDSHNPIQSVKNQAHYTYQNAIQSNIQIILQNLPEDESLEGLIEDLKDFEKTFEDSGEREDEEEAYQAQLDLLKKGIAFRVEAFIKEQA